MGLAHVRLSLDLCVQDRGEGDARLMGMMLGVTVSQLGAGSTYGDS